jgi:hypothetical protein
MKNPYGKIPVKIVEEFKGTNDPVEKTVVSRKVIPMPSYKMTPRSSTKKKKQLSKSIPQTPSLLRSTSNLRVPEGKSFGSVTESPLFDPELRAQIWNIKNTERSDVPNNTERSRNVTKQNAPPPQDDTPYKQPKVKETHSFKLPSRQKKSNIPIIPKHYYTVPSAEDLAQMSDEELSSVKNFTVGCSGVAFVMFHGESDVRNLDIGEIVELGKGSVVVYPDSTHKPPPGTSLNKPAIITIQNCFPHNKKGEIMVGEKVWEKFVDKLKQQTESFGQFVNYDRGTGAWIFEVSHF